MLGLLLDEGRPPQPPSLTRSRRGGRGRRVVGRSSRSVLLPVVLGSIMAFTSPIYLLALGYFLLAGAATVGAVLDVGIAADVRDALAAPVTLALGTAFFGVAFFYQTIREGLRRRSGKFISKVYGKAEIAGSILAWGLFALGYNVATPAVDASRAPELDGMERAWAIGGFGIAAIVIPLVLLAVAFLAPAIQGIGLRVLFVLTSAGAARYWVGAARDDHVLRVPVNPLTTLSFAQARAFVDQCSEDVKADVLRQLDEEVFRAAAPTPAQVGEQRARR